MRALREVQGVKQLVIRQQLDRARWLTVQLHLAGRDKRALRRIYHRVSRLAGQPPLQLRGRECTLNELFD